MTKPFTPRLLLTFFIAAGGTVFPYISAAQDLYVGNSTPNNTINLTSGTNAYGNTYVGFQSNASNNLLIVENTNTLLTNSGDVQVGILGSGNTLVITNGAVVDNGYNTQGGAIGLGYSTNNLVVVTGIGSTWSNGWDNQVGSSGSGNNLVISNGGKVLVGGGGYIGNASTAASNSVLVTGSSSWWGLTTTGSSGGLYIGLHGTSSSLIISNGGEVSDGIGYVGYFSGSAQNSVLVTGNGSTWSNSGSSYANEGSVFLGNGGSGTLTVANGGSVIATQLVIGESSTLNIGSLGGQDSAGVINSPSISFSSSSGSINFNQSNAFTLANSLSGSGSINQLGSGTTIFSTTNGYTGTTSVSNGTLLIGNFGGPFGSAVGTNTLTVSGAGTLGGNGFIGGATTITSGGKLAPGVSGAGALYFTNNLTLASGSATTFLIDTTNSYTSIYIGAQTLTFGGALTFNISSYIAKAGDAFAVFKLFGETSETGDFSSVEAVDGEEGVFFTDNGGNWIGTNNGVGYEFSDSSGTLTVTSVPEPTSCALLGLGALALLIASKRGLLGTVHD